MFCRDDSQVDGVANMGGTSSAEIQPDSTGCFLPVSSLFISPGPSLGYAADSGKLGIPIGDRLEQERPQ
jgi:hypothetical protein